MIDTQKEYCKKHNKVNETEKCYECDAEKQGIRHAMQVMEEHQIICRRADCYTPAKCRTQIKKRLGI